MTRRPLLTLLAVALTIAASVFLGALLAILVAFRLLLPDPATANSGDLGRQFGIAASRSAQQADSPTPSGEMTVEGTAPLPSSGFAGLPGVSHAGTPFLPALLSAGLVGAHPAVPPVGFAIATPVPGRGPVASREPRTATTLRGTASFVAPGYGARYLALPAGPGHRVRICGPSACVTRTSNDAGPDLAMQRAGRVADLSWADFRAVCACDPWVVGLVTVTLEEVP